MALRDLADELYEELQPVVEGAGVTLIDVEANPGRRVQFRVIIDAEAGVNIDDCIRVDRAVTASLMEREPMPGEWGLEVTSPGLERRLRRPAEYDHFRGRLAKLFSTGEDGEVREHEGLLEGLEGDEVLLGRDEGTDRFPLASIAKARLVFEDRKKPTSGRGR